MGSYIYCEDVSDVQLKSKSVKKNENKRIIKMLKSKLTLLKIIDTMKIYVQCVFPKTKLDRSEFDDVFCSMLNNTTPFFDILEEEGKADIYQAFITMAVFTEGHFDDKIKCIFSFFDLDGNGDLERKELSVFIISSI
jgi:hypothetical protein